jgi:hypothetical protein
MLGNFRLSMIFVSRKRKKTIYFAPELLLRLNQNKRTRGRNYKYRKAIGQIKNWQQGACFPFY